MTAVVAVLALYALTSSVAIWLLVRQLEALRIAHRWTRHALDSHLARR